MFSLLKKLVPNPYKDRFNGRRLWHLNRRGGLEFQSWQGGDERLPFGVNLFGSLDCSSGLGEAARSSLRALRAAGIPVYTISFQKEEVYGKALSLEGRVKKQLYAINLVHVTALQTGYLIRAVGTKAFSGRYNIGYWHWEMEQFPRTWDISFRYYNEIWVSTSYNRRAVSQHSSIPVYSIPHCLDVISPNNNDFPLPIDLPSNKLKFLIMFNMRSNSIRKNAIGAVQAYRKAFEGRSHVFLVIKVLDGHTNPDAMAILRNMLQGLEHVIILHELSREELYGLITECDTYISLHRSEGFGLIIAECMALGKTVVATGYSGNMDFMNEEVAYPVRFKLVRNKKHIEPYPKGLQWAEPDLDHAAERLRSILDNPDAAAVKGKKAAERMAKDWSPEAIGKKYKERLDKIYSYTR